LPRIIIACMPILRIILSKIQAAIQTRKVA
jgi:hypothetical protein